MTALAGVSFGLLVAYWSLSWRIDRLTEAKYDFLHGLVLFTAAEDHEPTQSNTRRRKLTIVKHSSHGLTHTKLHC